MYVRLLLAFLGLVIAAQTLFVGETKVRPLGLVQWTWTDTFPWVADFSMKDDIRSLFLLVALVFVVLMTTIATLGMFRRLFCKDTFYVKSSLIMFYGITVLGLGTFLWGAFLAPFSRIGWVTYFEVLQFPKTNVSWALEFPQSFPAWFLLAPLALMVINIVVREHHKAMRNYVRDQKGKKAAASNEVPVGTKIDNLERVLVNGLDSIHTAVRSRGSASSASVDLSPLARQIQTAISAANAATAAVEGQHRSISSQFDGIYNRINDIARKIGGVQPDENRHERGFETPRVHLPDNGGVRLRERQR